MELFDKAIILTNWNGMPVYNYGNDIRGYDKFIAELNQYKNIVTKISDSVSQYQLDIPNPAFTPNSYILLFDNMGVLIGKPYATAR